MLRRTNGLPGYLLRLTSSDFVLDTRVNPSIRMRRVFGVYQRILFQDRHNGGHPDSLSKRHEFDVDRDFIARRVCLIW